MWHASYKVEIKEPKNHYVVVTFELSHPQMPKECKVFLPSWSPGSYLMREYAKHLRCLKVTNQVGEELQVTFCSKSSWVIDIEKSKTQQTTNKIMISYEVYCHEVSVRTSFIDTTHAFLHGPSYLMGLENHQLENLEIEFKFPPLWSKITTALKEIPGGERSIFKYTANNYDELLDCPVEIGCHDTDGFKLDQHSYEIAIYGKQGAHQNNLKNDIKILTTTINNYLKDIPFNYYLFLIHFLPNSYGGLEHANSTVLMFDGRKLGLRKDYTSFLSLVAHEYFHAWNVKRIRPIELGPFDYQNENYTSMLWLAEGLTKLMDDYFVLLANLITPEEYVDFLKADLNAYFKTAGRKYDTLESSSQGAWIKLYRPHENSLNSSISYYLKGGLAFLCLHLELKRQNLSIRNVVEKLWKSYLQDPQKGITKDNFFDYLVALGVNDSTRDLFDDYISTTKELNFNKHFEVAGLEIVWEKDKFELGMDFEYVADRIIVKTVLEDSAAFTAGVNVQDEVLAVNGQRLLKADWEWFSQQLQGNTYYQLTVCRLGTLTNVEIMPKMSANKISSIKILDMEKFKKTFELT